MLMRAVFKEAVDKAQSASRQLQTAMATDSEGAGVAAPANEDRRGPALQLPAVLALPPQTRHPPTRLSKPPYWRGPRRCLPPSGAPGKHADAVKTTTVLTGQNSWLGGAC